MNRSLLQFPPLVIVSTTYVSTVGRAVGASVGIDVGANVAVLTTESIVANDVSIKPHTLFGNEN